MFTYKSLEEVSKMSIEEQQAYMTEKEAHEAGLRKKEIEDAIAKAQESNVSKEDLAALVAKQSEIIKEIERLALEAKKNNEPKEQKKGFASLREALKSAFEGAKESMQKAINGEQTSAIKVAVTMQVDNTIGAGTTQVTITDNTGVISPIRKRELTYLASVSVGRTNGNRALWIEEFDEQGTPIMLGEGDTKTQLSVSYEEKTANVKKIAVYGKVTTEMMADLPQLISYIENNLMKRMDIALENQLFNGDNLGDNLNGAFTLATAFSSGTLAATINNANDYDVIEAVALQTQLAFGVPNAIYVNPAVVSRMKLTKDSTGQYIMPPFAALDGTVVSGIRVVANTGIALDSFLVGDFSKAGVRFKEGLTINVGYENDDFTKNLVTILAEARLVQRVKSNHYGAFVKGVLSTAITALTKA